MKLNTHIKTILSVVLSLGVVKGVSLGLKIYNILASSSNIVKYFSKRIVPIAYLLPEK